MNSKKKSRLILILVLTTFLLPVILAKVFLSYDFYEGGKTNKGELFQTGISYQSLGQENPHPNQWQIIYTLPSSCDKSCQYQLYLLTQTHTALGREQERVIPMVALTSNADVQALQKTDLSQVNVNLDMGNNIRDFLVIVDPMGQLVMRYKLFNEQEQQIIQGKDLLADLRKMLKLSRIG